MHLALLVGLFTLAALPAMAGLVAIPPTDVPEPATLAVLAASVGALLMARRRRR